MRLKLLIFFSSLSFKGKKSFMCLCALPACMYVYHVCAWCLWRPEEHIWSSKLNGKQLWAAIWMWELNLVPLQEQKKNVSSLLSHSSSPLYLFFNINFHFKSTLSSESSECCQHRRIPCRDKKEVFLAVSTLECQIGNQGGPWPLVGRRQCSSYFAIAKVIHWLDE